MNDLLSRSFKRSVADDSSPPHSHSIEMPKAKCSGGSCRGGNNLDKFFLDVEVVNGDLKELDRLCHSLRLSHDHSKTLHNATAVKELKKKMDSDVSAALKTAKRVKENLQALDRSNEVNRSLPESGPGSSSDRQRTSVVNGLRKKLKGAMDSFLRVRETISTEYRDTIHRLYFTVTGEIPDEDTVDRLISTGESETFLQKAIQEQGRGRILDTINEIQERHDAVKDIEKSLNELHQVFLDMAVLVDHQGEQLDDIEGNVKRTNSYIRSGVEKLVKARFYQKNTRKWTCYAILLLIIIVVLVVLFTVKPWENNGGSGGDSTRQATPMQAQPPPPPSQKCKESGDPEKHYQEPKKECRKGRCYYLYSAIGECGLDYDRLQLCPPDIQKKYFEKQFVLPYATNKNRFTGGVAHSLTGSALDRDKLLSFDKMYIGVNGCSLKTPDNLDVVKGIPIERMMIETDSPYCEIKKLTRRNEVCEVDLAI